MRQWWRNVFGFFGIFVLFYVFDVFLDLLLCQRSCLLVAVISKHPAVVIGFTLGISVDVLIVIVSTIVIFIWVDSAGHVML